jgi:hypothetical protein
MLKKENNTIKPHHSPYKNLITATIIAFTITKSDFIGQKTRGKHAQIVLNVL